MRFSFLSRMFLRGLLVLLPLILTIYPLYYFFTWIDSITKSFLHWLFPHFDYVTGSGVLLGLVMIFLLGLLMSSRPVRKLFSLIETPLKNIPLVKSLYTAIKELTRYLAPTEDEKARKVVVVNIPGIPMQVPGFVIRDDLSDLPDAIDKDKRSAVYIPMSYQVGGFTVFLPNEWLSPVDMPVDEAMKNILTGWMTGDPDSETGTLK